MYLLTLLISIFLFLVRLVRDYWLVLVGICLIAYLLDLYSGLRILQIVNWASLTLAIFILPLIFIARRYALRVWGGDPADLSEMFVLQHQSVGSVMFEVSDVLAFVGFTMVLIALIFNRGWIILGVFLFIAGANIMRRQTSPPLVLFLAGSGDKTQQLSRRLARGLILHRVVNLLALPGNDIAKQDILGTSFRVYSENWNEAVQLLMRLSKIIVLDCRAQTAPLMEEAAIILRSEFIKKTIFITDEQGRCEIFGPLVAQRPSLREVTVFTIPENRLLPFIHTITRFDKGTDGTEIFRWLTIGYILRKGSNAKSNEIQ